MKTVYISGKISGLEESEYKPFFMKAEKLLKSLGYLTINPIKKGIVPGYKWEDYMKDAIQELCKCDYIYLLHNWEGSEGAKIEHEIAKKLKIPVLKIMNQKI